MTEIKQKKDLIVTEIILKQETEFNDGAKPFDIFRTENTKEGGIIDSLNDKFFRRIQKMNFYGVGKYSTDLSTIVENDIVVDDTKKIIVIQINKPEINSVEITDIEVFTPDKGWFVINDAEISLYESSELYISIMESMREELMVEEYYRIAEEDVANAIYEIFSLLLNTIDSEFNHYDIRIKIK